VDKYAYDNNNCQGITGKINNGLSLVAASGNIFIMAATPRCGSLAVHVFVLGEAEHDCQ
jgi:hypothetical protein